MAAETQPSGQVFDIGYQRYTGVREGRARARRSIYIDGLKSGLGIGRGGWAKFLPWLMIAPTIAVGLGFAIVAALFSQAVGDIAESGVEDVIDLPQHRELFTYTFLIVLLFAAVMGPEQLCPDRRQGVLHLYLVRPITLLDYLGSRWLAFATITFLVALTPQLTLLVGIMFGVPDLVEHIRENWTDIPRFIAASGLLAVFATSFTFAMASLTTRRMIATMIVMAVFIVSPILVDISLSFMDVGKLEGWIRLLDLSGLNERVNQIVFGRFDAPDGLPSFVPLVWYLLLSVALIAATRRIYLRLT